MLLLLLLIFVKHLNVAWVPYYTWASGCAIYFIFFYVSIRHELNIAFFLWLAPTRLIHLWWSSTHASYKPRAVSNTNMKSNPTPYATRPTLKSGAWVCGCEGDTLMKNSPKWALQSTNNLFILDFSSYIFHFHLIVGMEGMRMSSWSTQCNKGSIHGKRHFYK